MKNRVFKCLIVFIVIVTLIFTVFPAYAVDNTLIKGDVDYDGVVTVKDATAIQLVLANFMMPDENFNEVADFDSNGDVNIKDSTKIQLYLCDFPIEETTAYVTTDPTTQTDTEGTTESSAITEPSTSPEISTSTEPSTSPETSTSTEPSTSTESSTSTEPPQIIYPSFIQLDVETLTLGTGEIYRLLVSADVEKFDCTFTSSDNSVADVSPLGEISAVSKGTATIYAETANGLSAKCEVTVKPLAKSLTLNETEITLGVGESFDFNSKISSGYAAYYRIYTTDNTSVLSVTESGGITTAKKAGTAKVYCTLINGVQASCIVTVKPIAKSLTLNETEITLGVGESFDFNSKISSGYAAYYRIYTTDNTSVLSVAESGGITTAKKAGTAKVYCTLINGVQASCTVTVKPAATKLSLNKYDVTLYVGEQFDLNSTVPSGQAAYYRTYSSSNTSVAEVKASGGLVTAKKVGTAVVTCKLNNGVSAKCNIYVMPTSYKISNVPLIGQSKLPTGCETCSAVMCLKYYGYNISETTFADNYLIKKSISYSGNKMYAPDPNSAFVGSPYNSYSFGIYAPAMAKSMNKYLSDKAYKAVCLEGESLEFLAGKYIAQGKPVMVWATINMLESYSSSSWTVNYTDENAKYKNGSTFTWTANEHCLLLTGYDKDYYYFNDPWTNARVSYKKSLVNQRYAELKKQAIVLEKR